LWNECEEQKKGVNMLTRYLIHGKINPLAVFSVVAALLLAGCGGTSHASSAGSTPTSTSATTPGVTTATAILKHVPNGIAAISWNPTGKSMIVKISLVDLAPNSTHPAHIYHGSCSKQGLIVYPLQNVVADAHGVGTSTTTIKDVKNIPTTGWYVNIHNGPGLSTSDQSLSIVCGDIPLTNVSPASPFSLKIPLNSAPPASPGESVKGMAQLTLSGKTLTVRLTVSGLEPNSSHEAHIHAGSCANQGPVVYPLQTVKADASGHASETTTIKNVASIPTSGWYVHIHHGTALSTQTGFNPVACGDVKVS
jgi:hypothetical protein